MQCPLCLSSSPEKEHLAKVVRWLRPLLIMVTFVIAHSQFKLNCAPILRLTVGAHFIILILVEFNSNFVHETELDKFLRVVT